MPAFLLLHLAFHFLYGSPLFPASLDASEVLLSNLEVNLLLQESPVDGLAGKPGKGNKAAAAAVRQPSNLTTVQFEVKKYLSDKPSTVQTPAIASAFLSELSALSLTKAERLQIMNLRPTRLVELHAVRSLGRAFSPLLDFFVENSLKRLFCYSFSHSRSTITCIVHGTHSNPFCPLPDH